MDRTDEVPERYWVLRPFLHYSALDAPRPEINCANCGRVLFQAANIDQDINPMLMYLDKPLCPDCAVKKINEHPLTPSYLQWLDEGDPRWWSPWFCDCDGCEPFSPVSSDE